MNSSISSSDGWAGFLRRLGLATAVLAGLPFALLVLLDPYDTGRLTPFSGGGIGKASPRKAAASRGRDAAFDSAVIGNSTLQLMMPERLSQLTGQRFVNLTMPGSGPAEQLTLLSWFARHHAQPLGIIVGLDDLWCAGSLRRDAIKHPFPFWLFGSRGEYLAGLYTMESLEQAGRKLRLWAGGKQAARRDGYDDYEAGHDGPALPLPEAGGAGPRHDPATLADTFTALKAALAALPAETRKVLVFPPRHRNTIPADGTPGAATMAACKAAAREVAAGLDNASVVDFLTARRLTDAADGYRDPIHYRGWIAREMEDALSAALIAPLPPAGEGGAQP